MLKIKLNRIGKKGQPQYRIVVVEAKSNLGGTNVAEIGYYNPRVNPSEFRLDRAAYQAWIQKGAQPTDTIRHLAAKSSNTNK